MKQPPLDHLVSEMVFSDRFFSLRLAELWSKAGHFNLSQAKHTYSTTTWIWNLHSDAHDLYRCNNQERLTRKVFSSNLAHLSLVFFWLSGMHFHGAYFANADIWNKDPKHYLPSAQNVSSLIGQDILNSDIGHYFQGTHITSALFQLWRCEGIIVEIDLKYGCSASLIGTISCMTGAYFHMHIGCSTKTMALSIHHVSLLLGLSSISWSGHQIHISLPANRLLDSGIDPVVIPWLHDLLFQNWQSFVDSSCLETLLVSSTAGLCIAILTAHHFYLALVFISSGLTYISLPIPALITYRPTADGQLALNLLIAGSNSIAFGHHMYAIPMYPYIASDYPTVLSLFYHQINIGATIIIGAAAHASINIIRDSTSFTTKKLCQEENYPPVQLQSTFGEVLNHRYVIIGHLIYLSIGLGLHSFGLYIHNDTLQSFGRREHMFADNAIQLKPVFATLNWAPSLGHIVSLDIKLLDKKVSTVSQELHTADFLVHHIHAFTIHIALLILSKGMLYARTSGLVSDKLELGWRYPCDGPGRGGTCQISAYDHLYLAVFWIYNSLSVVLFHFSWKMQSDVWGTTQQSYLRIEHISGGDFSVNSSTINGWLRNFLWSQAAQVIQSYGTSISSYALIFICTHFIWAFSLMFLFSGRGYWQELIESILWAHHKLKIINFVQPRALSISQGRAVGLTHYTLGGIGCTFAFVISRMVVLS